MVLQWCVAYDEVLAHRIRELTVGEPGVSEKRMFGGLAFLVNGHMAVTASRRGGVMIRTDPAVAERLLTTSRAQPLEMRGRVMRGWLRVDDEHVRTQRELERWVRRGVAFARSLPAKS